MPGTNAGMFTVALTAEPGTTVIERVPVPMSTWSMVTLPGPCVTPKEATPPGAKSPSVTTVIGVQVSAHRTRIKMAWNRLAARNVKSTASPGVVGVKVTTTGANVPGTNAGMFTVALVGAPTTVIERVPVPASTWSMVTEPGPLDTPKDGIPPGNKSPSVTVVVGVQICCCADVCPLNRLTIAKSASAANDAGTRNDWKANERNVVKMCNIQATLLLFVF